MKRFLLFIGILFGAISTVISQDLPNPPSNLNTLPVGSYVIPMDNTYQLNSSALFNLKAYGLVVYLLNNHIKVKWVITSGKLKDGIDFTTTVTKVKPSSSGTSSASFKSGPFVIYAADLSGVDALIDAYYTANSLVGNNRPNVYQTTAAVTVDIRYNLSGFLPKAAILTDGGNQAIHLAFMSAAGIPSSNYTTSTGSNLISGCFTFASEPHNSKTGAAVDASINSIRNFVLWGGNFLAQCAAVENYENNALGRFQTSTGITVTNTAIGTAGIYPNPDLSFSQFEGTYNGNVGGAVQNWSINASGIHNGHNHYTGSGAASSSIGASVSKLKSGAGGLVFYLGNHNFSTSNLQNINGIRMYMNAFLTPSVTVCGSTLPVKLISFLGNLNNSKVNLQWVVAQNEEDDHFEVEKSTDGKVFKTAAIVIASSKYGAESYSINETMNSDKIYYRLKMFDINQVITFSKTLVFESKTLTGGDALKIINNPATDKLTLSFSSSSNQSMEIKVYDLTGRMQMNQKMNVYQGSNLVSLPLNSAFKTGIYAVEVSNGSERQTAKFVKQ